MQRVRELEGSRMTSRFQVSETRWMAASFAKIRHVRSILGKEDTFVSGQGNLKCHFEHPRGDTK